jgi:hypothetical protein
MPRVMSTAVTSANQTKERCNSATNQSSSPSQVLKISDRSLRNVLVLRTWSATLRKAVYFAAEDSVFRTLLSIYPFGESDPLTRTNAHAEFNGGALSSAVLSLPLTVTLA